MTLFFRSPAGGQGDEAVGRWENVHISSVRLNTMKVQFEGGKKAVGGHCGFPFSER